MDDPFGFALWLVAAIVLAIVAVVLLRALGPADWSLFRARRDASWPRGVQEEEPQPWHFDDRPGDGGAAEDPGNGGAPRPPDAEDEGSAPPA